MCLEDKGSYGNVFNAENILKGASAASQRLTHYDHVPYMVYMLVS